MWDLAPPVFEQRTRLELVVVRHKLSRLVVVCSFELYCEIERGDPRVLHIHVREVWRYCEGTHLGTGTVWRGREGEREKVQASAPVLSSGHR